jgi:Transposase, Mutator family
VRRTVPPSAEIEAQIDQLLAVGVGENPRESPSELAKLGARLLIQRAVEDAFDAWLGRARYERRPDYQRGLRNYESGLRNGFRQRTVQTAEGELEVEIPQIREAAETFEMVSVPTTISHAPRKTATATSPGAGHATIATPGAIDNNPVSTLAPRTRSSMPDVWTSIEP